MQCEICDKEEMTVAWTDLHGVAQCSQCGTPYTIYHYDHNGQRFWAPPRCLVKDTYKQTCRRYWTERRRPMPSGCSVPGGQEIASIEDTTTFYEWLEKEHV